jgi:hypothetical protein
MGKSHRHHDLAYELIRPGRRFVSNAQAPRAYVPNRATRKRDTQRSRKRQRVETKRDEAQICRETASLAAAGFGSDA